jgi:hypothetical protein
MRIGENVGGETNFGCNEVAALIKEYELQDSCALWVTDLKKMA